MPVRSNQTEIKFTRFTRQEGFLCDKTKKNDKREKKIRLDLFHEE